MGGGHRSAAAAIRRPWCHPRNAGFHGFGAGARKLGHLAFSPCCVGVFALGHLMGHGAPRRQRGIGAAAWCHLPGAALPPKVGRRARGHALEDRPQRPP
ncbi:MAG: hypothetical protein MZV49_18020 [Rhodopseudomonas palustris]|nr:hypothetical protein [Rhodopseudomonas palustris]